MAKKPPRLHELLAVEQASKKQADAISAETKQTFGKRRHHFEGGSVNVALFDADDPNADATKATVEAQHGDKKKEIVETVTSKLQYTLGQIRGMWDVMFQIAESNCRAKADVIVDGNVIVKDAPATFLLEMEKKVVDLRGIIHAIPTYDPTKGFKKQPDLPEGHYVGAPRTSVSTRKDEQPIITIKPTEHQAGQWTMKTKDISVAKITVTDFTSMYSPAEKSEMLERVDKLHRAIRKARQRANNVEACTQKISANVRDFVMGKIPPAPEEKASE